MFSEMERLQQIQERRAVAEFIREMGKEGLQMELDTLKERIIRYRKVLEIINGMKARTDRDALSYAGLRNYVTPFIVAIDKRIKKLEKLLKADEAEGITPTMVDQAKEYPIEQLLDMKKRGKTLCINHAENDPSMSIKNNRAHCFACGWSGDAIDVYMKLNNCDFKDAVKALQ